MLDFLARVAESVHLAVTEQIRNPDISKDLGMGADGTPTVYLDKLAEDVILKMAADEMPELNILSEEAGIIDNGGEYTLVADPIDGTKNAIQGVPYYSVSLAIGKKSLLDLEAGVVKNLATGDVFSAEKGKGAFHNGKPIRARPLNEKDMLFNVILGHKCHGECYRLATVPRRLRCMGSAALEICAVAGGQSDLFYMQGVPRKRNLRVFDIAAATLILREAGGEVYDETHTLLDMEFTMDSRSPVVAIADEKLWRHIECVENP